MTDDMQKELISGLLNLFRDNITMIILYGSVARNEATSESDVDIAIVMKKDMDEETKKRIFDRFYSIGKGKDANGYSMGSGDSNGGNCIYGWINFCGCP